MSGNQVIPVAGKVWTVNGPAAIGCHGPLRNAVGGFDGPDGSGYGGLTRGADVQRPGFAENLLG
jgi:hypothetical protein